jgi:phosphocarrier protein
VHLVKDNSEVDGKSILGILTMAAWQGTQLELLVSGRDEEQALKALTDLINNRFGEEE